MVDKTHVVLNTLTITGLHGETWACMREYLFGKHYHFIFPLRKKALINVNILLWLYNYHYNPVSSSENKLESLSLLLIDVSAIFFSVLQCLSIWLQIGPSMSSGEKYIISSGGQTRTTASGGISVLIKNLDLIIQIRIMFTSLSWILNLGEISTNQWFHLSATWNKDGNLTGYINGTWQNSVSSESYIPQNNVVVSNMHIGKPNNVDTSTYFGEVTLDEWYFWDNVFTTDHIKNLYEGYLQGTILSFLC